MRSRVVRRLGWLAVLVACASGCAFSVGSHDQPDTAASVTHIVVNDAAFGVKDYAIDDKATIDKVRAWLDAHERGWNDQITLGDTPLRVTGADVTGKRVFGLALGPDTLDESRPDVRDGQFMELPFERPDDAIALCKMVAPPEKAATLCTAAGLARQPAH